MKKIIDRLLEMAYKWAPSSVFFRTLGLLLFLPMLFGNWMFMMVYDDGNPHDDACEYWEGVAWSIPMTFNALLSGWAWYWIALMPVIAFFAAIIVKVAWTNLPDYVKRLDKKIVE